MSYGPPFSPAELAARARLDRMFARLRRLYEEPKRKKRKETP